MPLFQRERTVLTASDDPEHRPPVHTASPPEHANPKRADEHLLVSAVLDTYLQQFAHIFRTHFGVVERGVHYEPVLALSAGQGQRISTSANTIVGWSLRETTGAAPALLYLYDGDSPDGQPVTPIALSAGESNREFWPGGVGVRSGVYLSLVSGAIEGSIFVGYT